MRCGLFGPPPTLREGAPELARLANVSAPAASAHLTKLVDGKLLAVERAGRYRFYRLASPDIAHAIEAIAALTPSPRFEPDSDAEAFRLARTC